MDMGSHNADLKVRGPFSPPRWEPGRAIRA